MTQAVAESLRRMVAECGCDSDDLAPRFVESLLHAAVEAGVSDVHVQPYPESLSIAWRRDGLLESVGEFPVEIAPRIVTRLKVLAGLLTYERHLPQEGRLRDGPSGVEMRISVFPTVSGERVAIRLFAPRTQLLHLDDLGFTSEDMARWDRILGDRHGLVLITGPAGSGKTTTAYALMRELVRRHGGQVSLMSIEDPVEARLHGVAQSQVHEPAGFTLDVGLRSLLRQDPEIVLVGEIRDPTTARLVFRAALTGHLVITTYHAGSSADALRRLLDMGIESYMIKSGLRILFHQHLVRRLCAGCAEPDEVRDDLGLGVTQQWRPVGCAECGQSGFRGRLPITESFPLGALQKPQGIWERSDAAAWEEQGRRVGMRDRWQAAREAIEAGRTTPAEVRRVMGWE